LNLFELYAKISVDDADFTKSMESAQKTSNKVAKAVKSLQSPLDKAKSGFNAVTHPVETAKAGLQKLKDSTEAVRHPIETLKNKLSEASNALETKRNKLSTLSAAYDSAKKNVSDLTKEFNKSAKESGTSSKKTQELAKKLSDAEKEAEQAKKELDDYSDSVSKAGKKSDDASKSVGGFSGKLGKGIATAAKIGAAAVGVAASAISALVAQSISGFAEYEQLAGGAAKIFNDMDQSKILQDAKGAYKDLGMSANEYLAVINDVGASFANTMGDEKGYETARKGLKAIADYASGTGKNVDELSQKFTMITRSTSSYQSIADQFSGILPATSDAFLKQAQAAGLLDKKYRSLTQVPIDEYQEAVAGMLEKGTAELGLANNAAAEAMTTISGALTATKASWENLVTGLVSGEGDISSLVDSFVESIGALAGQIVPKIGTALEGASSLISEIFPVIMEEIPKIITENLPKLAEAAVGIIQSLISGISHNQGSLMETIFSVITFLTESFISMLPQIIELGLQLLVSLATGIAENIESIVPTLIDVILKIVETLTNPDNLGMLVDAAIAIMIGLANGLVEALPNLIAKAPVIISNLVTAIVENLPKIVTAAIDIIKTLAQGIGDNLSEIVSAGEDIIENIVAGAEALFSSILEVGKEIVEQIKEGISKAWEGLKSWFNDLWDSLFGDKEVKVDVKGNDKTGSAKSNANGLSYVPYDGYIALLHEGERVLTANEAKEYNSGYSSGASGSGITIVQNIQTVPQTPVEFAAATEAYFEQARWAF
jgi:phage-related protein